MANGFKVVSAGLFVTNVGRDRCVSGCARQVLSFTERDMFTLWVFVTLGEAEVDDVNVVFSRLIPSNHEVVGLDVTMDDSLFMHFLNTVDLHRVQNKSKPKKIETYHLDSDVEHCFEIKFAAALTEKIFKTLA